MSITRNLVRLAMKSDLAWEAGRRVSENPLMLQQRSSVVRKRVRQHCAAELSQNRVLQGVFEGLRYAETVSIGSTLWPKLFGTYESELEPTLNILLANQYSTIIDVGFAEGFYLIGFGLKYPEATLIGFDAQPEASRLCQANAKVNGIEPSRMHLFGPYEANLLANSLRPNTLCIVDCEGVENQVILDATDDQLKQADWLIEIHDHLVPGTFDRISDRLARTHHILEVHTDSTLERKRGMLPQAVRTRCDRYEQDAIVSEGRLESQRWLIATRNRQ